jgi:hypothetical protein
MRRVEDTSEAQIQKQLRALVTAVRPSILWRIDGITQPLDLLDDDGITGWQVGLGSISSQLENSGSETCQRVWDWIERERELEKSRWTNPRIVLAQARIVFSSSCWQLSRDQVLLERWLENIEAALARSPATHRTPRRTTQRHATHVLRLLRDESLASDMRKRLWSVVKLAPSTGPDDASADDGRLITQADLALLATWLQITEPAEYAFG